MHKILVVDDERLTADTLGLIFRKRGFGVQVAYTVDQALQSALDFQPDLILCDISMPRRDGIELLEEVGRQALPCRVLVLTGYLTNLLPVSEQIRKMPQSTHVLTKPCPPEDLLRAANRLLEIAC